MNYFESFSTLALALQASVLTAFIESEAVYHPSDIGGYHSYLRSFFVVIKVLHYEPWSVNSSCGGSLIGDMHVITSAHCITQDKTDPGKIFVEVSDHDQFREPRPEASKNITVSYKKINASYRIHPQYDPKTLDHDIALVYLRRKSPRRKSIKLCHQEVKSQYPLTTQGLGRIFYDGEKPGAVQEITWNDVSSFQCPFESLNLTGNVCFLGSNLSRDRYRTCSGDKGGPVYKVANNQPLCLYSLVSGGNICKGSIFGPRLCHYTAWIKTVWDNRTDVPCYDDFSCTLGLICNHMTDTCEAIEGPTQSAPSTTLHMQTAHTNQATDPGHTTLDVDNQTTQEFQTTQQLGSSKMPNKILNLSGSFNINIHLN